MHLLNFYALGAIVVTQTKYPLLLHGHGPVGWCIESDIHHSNL